MWCRGRDSRAYVLTRPSVSMMVLSSIHDLGYFVSRLPYYTALSFGVGRQFGLTLKNLARTLVGTIPHPRQVGGPIYTRVVGSRSVRDIVHALAPLTGEGGGLCSGERLRRSRYNTIHDSIDGRLTGMYYEPLKGEKRSAGYKAVEIRSPLVVKYLYFQLRYEDERGDDEIMISTYIGD